MAQESPYVYLQDKDCTVEYKVLKTKAFQSKTIFECAGNSDPTEDPRIPIVKADAALLEKLVEWFENHEDMELQDYQVKDCKILEEFDKKFFEEMDQAMHFEMIKLANFLNIPRLLDNSCKTIAAQIIGKSPEEIRQKFRIVNDFTPEEMKQVELENTWHEVFPEEKGGEE